MNQSNNEKKESHLFLFEVVFGKDLAMKYHDLFKLDKGKFEIHYCDEINEEKKENNNEEMLVNNEEEEENPERIKIRKEFGNNIGNDFKNVFISYLDKLFK